MPRTEGSTSARSRLESKPSKPESRHRKAQIKPRKPESKQHSSKLKLSCSRGTSLTSHQHSKDKQSSSADRFYYWVQEPTAYTGLRVVEGRANGKEGRVSNSNKERDEGQGSLDEAKGQAEEVKDTPSTNEDERDKERSARERRVYAEKKAASLGPSGL
jgi:hypothetical protein